MLPEQNYFNYKVILQGDEDYYLVEVFKYRSKDYQSIVVKDIDLGYLALKMFYVDLKGKSPMDNYRELTGGRLEC